MKLEATKAFSLFVLWTRNMFVFAVRQSNYDEQRHWQHFVGMNDGAAFDAHTENRRKCSNMSRRRMRKLLARTDCLARRYAVVSRVGFALWIHTRKRVWNLCSCTLFHNVYVITLIKSKQRLTHSRIEQPTKSFDKNRTTWRRHRVAKASRHRR